MRSVSRDDIAKACVRDGVRRTCGHQDSGTRTCHAMSRIHVTRRCKTDFYLRLSRPFPKQDKVEDGRIESDRNLQGCRSNFFDIDPTCQANAFPLGPREMHHRTEFPVHVGTHDTDCK